MEKIYGYKEKDVLGLAEFIKNRGNKTLTWLFKEYAVVSGKAMGTVRNLYYALAKRAETDKEFNEKYGLSQIKVNSPKSFDTASEKEIIKKILNLKKSGYSVRSAVNKLSSGDTKLSLRYQNKYRNALKNKPDLIAELIAEIKTESGESTEIIEKKQEFTVSEFQMKKLKKEINGLVERISEKIRKENEYLKKRLTVLQMENMRLNNLLYGTSKRKDTSEYFKHSFKDYIS